MDRPVDISFDCLPLRSVGRLDIPLDASPVYRRGCEHIKHAIETHGSHNTYFLYNAGCTFHLTNDETVGMLQFRFEGTALTDASDQKTLSSDLEVELVRETCDWLTEPIVAWFLETVPRVVTVEFDRYIAAGDLAQAVRRVERHSGRKRQPRRLSGHVSVGGWRLPAQRRRRKHPSPAILPALRVHSHSCQATQAKGHFHATGQFGCFAHAADAVRLLTIVPIEKILPSLTISLPIPPLPIIPPGDCAMALQLWRGKVARSPEGQRASGSRSESNLRAIDPHDSPTPNSLGDPDLRDGLDHRVWPQPALLFLR